MSRVVQESVIVVRFLETECVGSLEFVKTKVFAQLCHVVTLRCPAQRTTKELLRLVSHLTPIALPCLSRALATDFSSIHWDQPPACRPHAPQCKCPAPCSQTNKDRAHLERNRVLSTCSTGFLPASRRCSKTQHGLAHFPHHTSAIHQNLRAPPFGWLRIQLFTFADFSVEECLGAVGHKSFVSLITVVERPCQEHTDALNCCCCCRSNLRHSEVLRYLLRCTWISKLLAFSSCPPSDKT